MKSSRINYVVVGAFVLLMIAGLTVTLAMLAGRTGPTDTYYTVYNRVNGVKFGTQVLFEGYPVGVVQNVEPLRGETGVDFRVALAVEKGWTIPEGSTAAIVSSGLLAGVAVEISGGASEQPIPPGGTIPGRPGTDMFAAMAKAANAVANLSEGGLQPLLAKLNGYVDELGGAVARDTPEILANLRTVTAELAVTAPQIAADLKAVSAKLDQRLMSERNLAAIDATLVNAEQATARVATLADDLQDTGRAVRALTARLGTVVDESGGDVRLAAKDMRYTLDAVARQIDSILYNLDASSRNMAEFSRSIRQNPALLLGGSPPQERGPRQ